MVIRTKDENRKRIDLISNQGFDDQFYEEFVEAFDMLETVRYDAEAWYK